jgi:CDP-paratose 2-epimerase
MYDRILITGGAGFVGSHVALTLKKEYPGSTVTALDNLSRAGSETNLPLLEQGGIAFCRADVGSLDDLTAAANEPDLIIDCAADPSALAGYGGSPQQVIQTNVLGTSHCLELARRAEADFLFVSTSRVYPYRALNAVRTVETETRFSLAPEQEGPGVSEHGIAEDFPLGGPRSIYGMTKLVSEYMVEECADAYGIRFIINRSGVLTGPRQMGKTDQGLIVLWLASHFWKRPLRYIGFGGSGKQVRDVLHIEDFCDLIADQVRHFERYQGERYNVGGGPANSVSLLELTALCRELTGNEIPIQPDLETRPADIRLYLSDNRKVHGVRGWEPQRTVAQALEAVHTWLEGIGEDTKSALLGGLG